MDDMFIVSIVSAQYDKITYIGPMHCKYKEI